MALKSLILAAGFGTRLNGTIGNGAKGFIPVEREKNTTLIERMVKDLMGTEGIDLHSLVTNGLYVKQYETWFNSRYPNFPIQIINNKSTTPEKRLGAIGDLMFAVERLGWWNENILILPSDTYYEFPLQRLVDFVQEKRDFVTIVRKFTSLSDIAGKLGCAVLEKNIIVDFIEKPEEPPSNFGAIPFYYYPKRILKLLKKYKQEGGSMDAPGYIIPWLIKEGEPVYAMVTENETYDIGRPEDLKLLKQVTP